MALNKLGVHSLKDLAEFYPREYQDRTQIRKLNELIPEAYNYIIQKVISPPENMEYKNKILTKLSFLDETASLTITWFNQPYLKASLKVGKIYFFCGKVREHLGHLQMENPEYYLLDDVEDSSEKEFLSGCRIVPIYALEKAFSQATFRGLIKQAIDQLFAHSLFEDYEEAFRKKYQLVDKEFAIKNIHFPNSDEDFFLARRRLVFDEFFTMMASLSEYKRILKEERNSFVPQDTDLSELKLPFTPTGAQQRVLREIIEDLRSQKVMNRLIQGDVGSGKTFVAFATAYIIIKNGGQAALMAPTEVLAEQHFNSFCRFFEGLESQGSAIQTTLLTGSIKKREKKAVYEGIQSGYFQMIIGTHALIQDAVEFSKLALVITDEQHRFGVRQRSKLSEKGESHVLVMSATPIPRTLALVLYADLDISIIDELPPGRQPIQTVAVNSSYHSRIYSFILEEIKKGRQAYIICPMIESDDGEDSFSKYQLNSVLDYAEKLKIVFQERASVAILHGKMKPQEKTQIIQEFYTGNTDVLISTTVIEVGIDVPNASIMLIENAERFGLSQLHQLRGRVGRGSEKSYCILITDSKAKVTRQRVQAMTKTSDGFVLSELDLKLRGQGDFFGTRQSGIPLMKIADLYKDMELLKLAQQAVLNGAGIKMIKRESFNTVQI